MDVDMSRLRSLAAAITLAVGLLVPALAAFGAVPPPVPALPDVQRQISFNITNSTCACSLGSALNLYGDSTDYQNWIEVWLNGVNVAFNDATFGWTITSPTGPLATIPRPITDGVLTFNTAQTGTVIIVGARRPRRTSQFQENVGVPTRNFNVVLSDIIAMLREVWDKINDVTGRAILGEPGDVFPPLPPAANRAGFNLCFNSTGAPALCAIASGSGTIASGTGIAFTGTNPTTISQNTTAGTGIAVAPSGVAEQVSLANMAADTIKCNPTGSSAAPIDCSAVQLATITGPNINTFTTNHTIATTDCGNVVQMGTSNTGQLNLTLPSVSSFSGACPIEVFNGNVYVAGNAGGVILSGAVPGNEFYILFPQQSFELKISNGNWVTTRQAGRWLQPGPQLYASNGGSDTATDCLSPATACATIGHVVNGVLYPRIDNLNGSPLVLLSGTFNECDTFQGQLTGTNVGFIEGTSPGAATWDTSGACAALLIADNAEWETQNILFTSSPANGSGIFVHQPGVVDILDGTNFGSFAGTGSAIGSDHGGFINFDQNGAPVNIGPGGVGIFLLLGPGTQMVGDFTAVGQSTINIGTWMVISGAGTMANYTGIAVGGSFASIGASTCRGPSAFTLGSSLPGGAPTATLGCQSM
jgi:hypothetical protein